jgi:hypothetical protein
MTDNKLSRFRGKLHDSTQQKSIEVNLDLIEYQEADLYYAYSPALDLVGYGITPIEARQSWEIVLQEYITYTLNKNTLRKDLQSRGWAVKKGSKQFRPPTISWLLQNNKELANVYDKHNFKKSSTQVLMPVAYA